MFQAIRNHVKMLAFHPKGNYVLSAIMNILREKMHEFIVNGIIDNLSLLSRDQYGICLVNKVIQFCKDQSQRERIV